MKPLRIGNVTFDTQVVLAPLAGITDLPFRLIARKFHTGLIHTEMISGLGAIYQSTRTGQMYRLDPRDKPVSVQLLGRDPVVMGDAARLMEDAGADIIDINLGCSVRKVISQGSGAALLEEPQRISEIIRSVVGKVNVPVTVKMRKGFGKNDRACIRVARIAEESGASAICIHGRTAAQGFTGTADWDIVSEIVQMVKIPVIGSGDIRNPEDALRRMEQSRCAAVMLGRATLGNPWILQEAADRLAGGNNISRPADGERFSVVREHLQLSKSIFRDAASYKRIRKHLAWYTRGLPCAARIRELFNAGDSYEALENLIDHYVSFLHLYRTRLEDPSPIHADSLFRECMAQHAPPPCPGGQGEKKIT